MAVGRGVTKEQADRILALLLRPEIEARKAYPTGTSPWVMEHLPWVVNLTRDMSGYWVRALVLDGQFVRARTQREKITRGKEPEYVSLRTKLADPGTYRLELQYECYLRRRRITVWRWNPFRRGTPALKRLLPFRATRSPPGAEKEYRFEVTASAEINMVDPAAVREIPLISSPELDAAMRAALTRKSRDIERSYFIPGGRRTYHITALPAYTDLPAAVAFEVSLRLADGREIRRPGDRPYYVRARAGSSGIFRVNPGLFRLEETGEYQGVYVFTPNPTWAYEDPAIEAIWAGTWERPIRFTITDEPPPDGQREPKNATEGTTPPTEGQTP
jgi:hypothetical protein